MLAISSTCLTRVLLTRLAKKVFVKHLFHHTHTHTHTSPPPPPYACLTILSYGALYQSPLSTSWNDYNFVINGSIKKEKNTGLFIFHIEFTYKVSGLTQVGFQDTRNSCWLCRVFKRKWYISCKIWRNHLKKWMSTSYDQGTVYQI